MKLAFFFGVSMALVLGSTFVAYIPDYGYIWLSSDSTANIYLFIAIAATAILNP